MGITFEVEAWFSLTQCKFQEKVKIGSVNCHECEHFISLSLKPNLVMCEKYKDEFEKT